jgi:hypothetical protein
MHAGPELDLAARAMERLRVAKSSGDRVAIAAAGLNRAQKALKRVKAEATTLAEIAKALGEPRHIGW